MLCVPKSIPIQQSITACTSVPGKSGKCFLKDLAKVVYAATQSSGKDGELTERNFEIDSKLRCNHVYVILISYLHYLD